jgi:dTDP-glucose 4,6-dehydratase
VRAYYHTYGLPATISNCSNNYGPYQFPEKLIPLMIMNMMNDQALPVYGDGRNVRDWLYVEDHAGALWTILNSGSSGESYNVGGENEYENIALVSLLCEIVAELTGKSLDRLTGLVRYVKDRPGHDRRYAINCEKLKKELGWTHSVDLQSGLQLTVRWYLEHQDWVESVRTGEYARWIECNYHHR